MGEIVIAPMVDRRAQQRRDRLRAARIAGLKEAAELCRAFKFDFIPKLSGEIKSEMKGALNQSQRIAEELERRISELESSS